MVDPFFPPLGPGIRLSLTLDYPRSRGVHYRFTLSGVLEERFLLSVKKRMDRESQKPSREVFGLTLSSFSTLLLTRDYEVRLS